MNRERAFNGAPGLPWTCLAFTNVGWPFLPPVKKRCDYAHAFYSASRLISVLNTMCKYVCRYNHHVCAHLAIHNGNESGDPGECKPRPEAATHFYDCYYTFNRTGPRNPPLLTQKNGKSSEPHVQNPFLAYRKTHFSHCRYTTDVTQKRHPWPCTHACDSVHFPYVIINVVDHHKRNINIWTRLVGTSKPLKANGQIQQFLTYRSLYRAAGFCPP